MSTRRAHGFELPVSAERWMHAVYLEDAYTLAMHREGLGFDRIEVVEVTRTDDRVTARLLRARPPSNAPKVVQKVLGSSQEYEERGELADDGLTWRYTVTPSAMADKIRIEGVHRVSPLGDDRCRVDFEAVFAVSLFGIGAALERFMAGQFDNNLARQERFARRWVSE